MAVGANEIAAHMKRISELTELLMTMQENSDAHALAARIHQEIASVREQLRRASASDIGKKSLRPPR